jgi:ubiquinone biosynthesis protein UbiJ
MFEKQMNPQYEAHERFCKSIGDMAKENEALKQRIKRLEEALESANTFLQLVMYERNHLREVRNKANDRIKRLEDAGDLLAKTQTYDLLETVNWRKAKEAKP